MNRNFQSDELKTTSGGNARHSSSDELRYRFASGKLPNGLILDDGCGFGHGTTLLLREDRHVIGIDPDERAINEAMAMGRVANLEFQLKISDSLSFGENHFDAAVSLEVIEHLKDQRKYINELARVLKSNGILILSTPNRLAIEPYYISGLSPINIRHISELSPSDLRYLVEKDFEIAETFVLHATDIKQRQESLQYQSDFPIPYRLRSKIPLNIRNFWSKHMGKSTADEWTVETMPWDNVETSDSLRCEDIVLKLKKKVI